MRKVCKSENCVFWFSLFFAGYARIVLAIVSFYFMPTNYVISSWCYIISVLLDALDGHAARKFNQCNLLNLISPRTWGKKIIDISLLCHWELLIPNWLFIHNRDMNLSIFSDEVRGNVGSIDGSVRNHGTARDAELFLP